MSDITAEGMAIAPGVIETIVVLAVREVEGVASVGSAPSGIASLFAFRQSTQGVVVEAEEDGRVAVTLSIQVLSGFPLGNLAVAVREAVANALTTQVGLEVSRVDVHVDGIQFAD